MKIGNREQKNWIYHWFQVVDNIQQSTANIDLGSFSKENNLPVFNETALKDV